MVPTSTIKLEAQLNYKPMKNQPTVTKEFLIEKLRHNPSKVIGRALLAIYNRQTNAEQEQAHTKVQNGIGFSKPDARVGSIGARQFKNKGTLDPWLITVWMRLAKDGTPRICKYAGQLNEIAQGNQMVIRERLVNTPHENAYVLNSLQTIQ